MASEALPRVAVVGAGAVGGYFGGCWHERAPTSPSSDSACVDVWKRDGLFVDSINFQERIRVAASTDVAAAADADLVPSA
jgi:ketopantoate reductase